MALAGCRRVRALMGAGRLALARLPLAANRAVLFVHSIPATIAVAVAVADYQSWTLTSVAPPPQLDYPRRMSSRVGNPTPPRHRLLMQIGQLIAYAACVCVCARATVPACDAPDKRAHPQHSTRLLLIRQSIIEPFGGGDDDDDACRRSVRRMSSAIRHRASWRDGIHLRRERERVREREERRGTNRSSGV